MPVFRAFTANCTMECSEANAACLVAAVQVPAEMYSLLPLALAPVLGNPVRLLAAGVESDAPAPQQAGQLLGTALNLLQQLPLLADILPAGERSLE